MKHNSLSKIGLITLSVLTIVFLSAWFYLIYKSALIRGEIVFIASEARNKTSENTHVTSLRSVLRDSKANLATIDSRFVNKEDLPNFISILENQAADIGIKVDIGSITPEAANESTFPTIRIKMVGSGTWEKTIKFVATLDSLHYLSRIENLTLNKVGSQDKEAVATTTWNFNLDFVQYLKE